MRKKLHSVTAFDVILAIIMVLICFACVYPMWYILANSLAAPEIANRGPVAWWPKALSLDAYKVVFQNEYILSGFKITILRTVVATFTHVFFHLHGRLRNVPEGPDREKVLLEDCNDHHVF